jgi:hypothetical protein
MGKVDHEENAIDKRVSERDQGIDPADGQPVDNLIDDDCRVE